MSSPGVMHARQFEPVEWMVPLDPQEARDYPAGYEEARRRLVSHLLSITAAPLEESKATALAAPRDPVPDSPDFERSRVPLREPADKSARIRHDPAGGKRRGVKECHYVSSFDRLTARKPKANIQPAPVPIGVHLRNVLAIAVALSVGALVYASVGGGFPGLSAAVRSFLDDQVAKVRLILPGHDVGNPPTAPAPLPPPSVKAASPDQTAIPTYTESSERLLYSTASIAFMPLK